MLRASRSGDASLTCAVTWIKGLPVSSQSPSPLVTTFARRSRPDREMRTRNPATPGRVSSRWEPRWRFTRHPILSKAARTRLALLAGQLLIWNREGNVEGGRRKFLVCNSVSNDLNSEALSVADRFIASPPVTHHARKLKGIGDPATVFLPIQINRQLHFFIISCLVAPPYPDWFYARSAIRGRLALHL